MKKACQSDGLTCLFVQGLWTFIYSSSKNSKCLLPSSSPLSTVVVGFEDETSVPEAAINDS